MDLTQAECLIHTILGPTHRKIRPFAACIDRVEELLFVQKVHMEDIRFMRDVYPVVAERMHQNCSSLTRLVERLANDCWRQMRRKNLVETYIGSNPLDPPYPAELTCYLACYLHLGRPFSQAIL